MILYVPKEEHKYIMIFDIEFSQNQLVQFSGLLFKSIGKHIYQLSKSLNQYVKTEVDYRFVSYTGISSAFLQEKGVSLKNMQDFIEEFLKDIPDKDLLVVSHGLKSDLLLLESNGINLKTFDKYCTYKNSRRLLKRENKLKVKDIAEESGYFLDGEHNAFRDVWAHVSIFCYLKKIEYFLED